MATYVVNVDGCYVKTTVTDQASSVDNLITELILSCNYNMSELPMIGLAVEFLGPDHVVCPKVAILQLCSRSRCVILQLRNMKVVPQSLINLLSAPLFCFVGVGVQGAALSLERDYGLGIRNLMDLETIVDLLVLVGAVQVELRPLSVVLGNWGAQNLSLEQIECAMDKSYVFCKIARMLELPSSN